MNITVDCKDFMKFLTHSQEIPLPKENAGKKKVLDALFHNSCMVTIDSKGNYTIGQFKEANCSGYSMVVDGKEKIFLYSDLTKLFKPKLC